MSLLVEAEQIPIYGIVVSVGNIYIAAIRINIDSIRSVYNGSIRDEILPDSLSGFQVESLDGRSLCTVVISI